MKLYRTNDTVNSKEQEVLDIINQAVLSVLQGRFFGCFSYGIYDSNNNLFLRLLN